MTKTSWFKRIFRNTQHEHLEEANRQLEEQLTRLTDDFKKLYRWSRRQSHFLESMQQEINSKLDATYKKVTAPVPYEAIGDFVQSFTLFCLQQNGTDPSRNQLWSKFSEMLKALDMELIVDLHAQFKDTRHSTCDVRFDPKYPEGTILEVVRPGLIVQGRLQTQAVVVVNKNQEQESQRVWTDEQRVANGCH